MELTETIAFIRRYNAWRRGYQGIEQPQPYQIGQALDALCDHAERLERELEDWKDKLDGSEITHEVTRADLRDCKRELEQERQDRKQADLDTIRALGERNDERQRADRMAAWLVDYLRELDWVYDATCNCPDCEFVRGIKTALGETEP